MTTHEVPLIPRKLLFGNPDRAMVQISPDGKHLSWLAPLDGVLNVWVAPRDDLEAARPVTHDAGRGIRFYGWAYTNDRILYIQDKNGDENWRLYAVDLAADTVRDLTPYDGVQARLVGVSHKHPETVIVALNDRHPSYHDVYGLALPTGERTLLLQNDRFFGVHVDDDYRVRFAEEMTPDGGIELFIADADAADGWSHWDSIPPEDQLTTGFAGFGPDNRVIYMNDSRGRNTAALVEVEPEHKAHRVLADDPVVDAGDVLIHPTTHQWQGVSFTRERRRWEFADQRVAEDFAVLRTYADGDAEIISRTLDDEMWIVAFVLDDSPMRYYLYDRAAHEAHFLFTNRKELEGQPLVKMHAATIVSRDGYDLVCYYSLPPGSDPDGDGYSDRPAPLVLFPHGGPWGRDEWGFNGQHQLLANRGYAVLSVNFRASTGFGKAFVNAGDREWGGKVMEDQQDAVRWAIAQGIADPERIAVMGGSFGGYSVLAGLTLFPETFACGVDLVGPSNLLTLLESVPPYWKPMFDLFATRVGDPRTEEGRALLQQHSPLTHVEKIRSPLLIGQGANDPRVKQAESDQIVAAMQAKGIPVTYALYPDEGHGFARPENNLSFSAIAEAFLARCLGGRVEPIGDDFKGASLTVPAGVDEVAGLAEALAAPH